MFFALVLPIKGIEFPPKEKKNNSVKSFALSSMIAFSFVTYVKAAAVAKHSVSAAVVNFIF